MVTIPFWALLISMIPSMPSDYFPLSELNEINVNGFEIDNELYGFPHEKCGTGLYIATKKEAKNSKCAVCKKSFLEDDQ